MAKIAEVQEVSRTSLKPYARNAKIHSAAQVEKIADSIKEFGFLAPVLIDRQGNIIAGHGRVMAAEKLGMETVPCVYIEGLTEAQRKAYILADNRLGELAEWDMDLVAEELHVLEGMDFDISLTGFELDTEVEEGAVEDDYEPIEIEQPKSKRGDIYQLGRHRLMCGDSTSAEDVSELMGGVQADLLLTDPPYNVALGMDGQHPERPSEAKQRNRRTDGKVIQNDSWESNDEFVNFLSAALGNGREVLREGAPFYIWYANTQELNFFRGAEGAGLQVRQVLIWAKNSLTLGRQDYQWRHEPCLYGWKAGAGHPWYSDRKQTTVLEFDRPTRSDEHPTMKPVPLFDYLIKNSTKEGDVVLDLFGGSGTTIVACEQSGRSGYLMELDPLYVDTIIDRWQKLTGEEAVLCLRR